MSKSKEVEKRIWFWEYPEEDGASIELFIDQKSVLIGDWYHDKIEERIEGYLKALEDEGYKLNVIESSQKMV